MKKLAALLLLCAPALGSTEPIGPLKTSLITQPKITVSARGHDVRLVLTDIFQQAKKSCVIQHNIQYSLYLSFSDTPFDEALKVVCQQAGLDFEVKDGVYFIHTEPKAIKPKPAATATVAATSFAPAKLASSVLTRRVNTRLTKTPIQEVLNAFAEQTKTKIELDPQVPAYKLDAFLINTSLKYALDRVTKAAGLTYKFTDHESILVTVEDKVALSQ